MNFCFNIRVTAPIMLLFVLVSCKHDKDTDLNGQNKPYNSAVNCRCTLSDTLCMLQGVWEPAKFWQKAYIGGGGVLDGVHDAKRIVILDSSIYNESSTMGQETYCLGTTYFNQFRVKNHLLEYTKQRYLYKYLYIDNKTDSIAIKKELSTLQVSTMDRFLMYYPSDNYYYEPSQIEGKPIYSLYNSSNREILSLSEDTLFVRGPIHMEAPKNEQAWAVQNYYKYYKAAKP